VSNLVCIRDLGLCPDPGGSPPYWSYALRFELLAFGGWEFIQELDIEKIDSLSSMFLSVQNAVAPYSGSKCLPHDSQGEAYADSQNSFAPKSTPACLSSRPI
jgi:hypothetical protein